MFASIEIQIPTAWGFNSQLQTERAKFTDEVKQSFFNVIYTTMKFA